MRRMIAALVLGLSLLGPGMAAAAPDAAAPPATAPASDPVGVWMGVLTVGATPLHLAVHITGDAKGYSGSMDSLDQGAMGMALGEVTAASGKLAFTVPMIGGAYAGQWDAVRSQWIGQWTQRGHSLPLNLTRGAPAASSAPAPVIQGLDGDWDGALQMGAGMNLRLAFHIKTGPGGTSATMDSIDQQASGMKVDGISRQGDAVRLDMPGIRADFQGTLDAAGQTITGAWTQPGLSTPLILRRRAAGAAQATLNRPQTPVKPYPYREEEVAFDSAPLKTGGGRVRLAGTLTLPPGKGPFPVAVLVSGSGPNTRDEPILGHRLFLVLADNLTRKGIAVLRYDKRGTGGSSGDYGQATTTDFADDAQAAVKYLRTRPEIDPRRVGLIGHSEGGLMAPIVGVRDPSLAFIVLMAGPGVDGSQIWLEQLKLILKAAGATDAQIAKAVDQRRQTIAVLVSEPDPVKAQPRLAAIYAADLPAGNHSDQLDALVKQINNPWFREFLTYDPQPTLRRLRVPVLVLDGSLDLQVPPGLNLPALRAALAGDPDAEFDELPNLNHLFQTAKTGGIGEYGQIEETMAPTAMDRISAWILKRVGPAAP